MNVAETETWLIDLRFRRDNILRERSEVAAETQEAVRDANKAGVPKTKIAKLAGISRQTVHEMLKD